MVWLPLYRERPFQPLTRRSACATLINLASTVALAQEPRSVLRVGHFLNFTHIQGLVSHHMSRHGYGWFQPRLGGGVMIEWSIYNAGPSALVAIFAGLLDLVYVGPGPVINAYMRAGGGAVRILAGAAEGGAGLVILKDSTLATPADFRGRRIATPQFGNTQDVAARAWLSSAGLHIAKSGGHAQVIPAAYPDQFLLFKTRQVEAVWTVKPWVSRPVNEADGKVLIDERDAITTVLAASTSFLSRARNLARRFVAAHAELTEWIRANPGEAQRMVRDEMIALTRTDIRADLIAQAWLRIELTGDVSAAGLATFVTKARSVGFLRRIPSVSDLIENP